MEYLVEVRDIQARTTAVVRRRASLAELARVVPDGCGEVWAFIRSSGLPHPGRNLALYLDDAISLEVVVEVTEPFVGTDLVTCSSTPAGTVASTQHVGPYERLGEAHKAIRRWCADQGHVLAGPNWEVYGHWTDGPEQLQTDVYYLLQGVSDSAG